MSRPEPRATDRPVTGILLMLGFCVLAPFGDAAAKELGRSLGVTQIVMLRFLVQAILLVPLIWLNKAAWPKSPALLGWIALRTLLHIAGLFCMVLSLVYLPLADAVAIAFVMPFFALFLGHWLLGEHVGRHRIAASLVGFAGTLMVIQPAFQEVGWPALLPIGVALAFALFMLATRKISNAVEPITLQAVSAVLAVVLLAPVVALAPPGLKTLSWSLVASGDWLLIFVMGCLGTLAHLFMTWSLKLAPASTLAPMQYLEIPVATLVGYLLFGDLPGRLAGFGILVTILAGLYVIWREQANQQAARPEQP